MFFFKFSLLEVNFLSVVTFSFNQSYSSSTSKPIIQAQSTKHLRSSRRSHDRNVLEEDLPPGWERRETREHKVYYVNHNKRTTHWKKPSSSTNSSSCNARDGELRSSIITSRNENSTYTATSKTILNHGTLAPPDINACALSEVSSNYMASPPAADESDGATNRRKTPCQRLQSSIDELSVVSSSVASSSGSKSSKVSREPSVESAKSNSQKRVSKSDSEPLPDGWELRYDLYDRYLYNCWVFEIRKQFIVISCLQFNSLCPSYTLLASVYFLFQFETSIVVS